MICHMCHNFQEQKCQEEGEEQADRRVQTACRLQVGEWAPHPRPRQGLGQMAPAGVPSRVGAGC